MSSKSQAGARSMQAPLIQKVIYSSKNPSFVSSVAVTPGAITVAAMATQVLRGQTAMWYHKMMSVMTVQRPFQRDT